VPLALNGRYSLPVNLTKPLFPLTTPQQLEARGDNLQSQYWYARPFVSLPQLVLMIGVDTQTLYQGIYLPGWQWWLLALVLQLLLTLLFFFLRQKATDPKRQLLVAMRQRQFFDVHQRTVTRINDRLIDIKELPFEEISNILEMSVSTCKTNYHYAKEKIENYIRENYES
jgi:sensor c-di-GMP phosphodiesterase-like protein